MHIQKTEEDTFGDMLDEEDRDEQMTQAEIFEYGAGTHMRLPTEGKDIEATEPLLKGMDTNIISDAPEAADEYVELSAQGEQDDMLRLIDAAQKELKKETT